MDSETWTEQDRRFMGRALALARRARHRCRPNPMVGAVLVRNGRVLGKGWHRKAGGPHAEVEALRACVEDPRGATMYVTLEPCCGREGKRTPPCAPALIEAGIARLVAATLDPHPLVRGKGLSELRAAGVAVQAGLLEREARTLNDAFAWHAVTGRPFTTLKLALTLDGRIADAAGRSQWITSERARAEVHRLRAQMDAILVGRATADADDPSLTVRLRGPRGPQPLRVVLGAPHRADLRLLTTDPERTHLFVPEAAELPGLPGVHVHRTGTEPGRVLETLAALGVQRLLVEGGGRVAGSFLDAGLVQRVWLFYAPLLLGDALARPAVAGAGRPLAKALRLGRVRSRRLGPDLFVEGFLQDPIELWEASTA
jgi:diaminohydroxyphosphoribosylaminopyrimidine deaminase/5-amino-6-(5-phosphoribosylamino)uracil reductase